MESGVGGGAVRVCGPQWALTPDPQAPFQSLSDTVHHHLQARLGSEAGALCTHVS